MKLFLTYGAFILSLGWFSAQAMSPEGLQLEVLEHTVSVLEGGTPANEEVFKVEIANIFQTLDAISSCDIPVDEPGLQERNGMVLLTVAGSAASLGGIWALNFQNMVLRENAKGLPASYPKAFRNVAGGTALVFSTLAVFAYAQMKNGEIDREQDKKNVQSLKGYSELSGQEKLKLLIWDILFQGGVKQDNLHPKTVDQITPENVEKWIGKLKSQLNLFAQKYNCI